MEGINLFYSYREILRNFKILSRDVTWSAVLWQQCRGLEEATVLTKKPKKTEFHKPGRRRVVSVSAKPEQIHLSPYLETEVPTQQNDVASTSVDSQWRTTTGEKSSGWKQVSQSSSMFFWSEILKDVLGGSDVLLERERETL